MKESEIVACGMTQTQWDKAQHEAKNVILRQQEVSNQKRNSKRTPIAQSIKISA